MIDRFSALDDDDYLTRSAPLDLSSKMRELRARQGLKQSQVARRLGVDPSIPSLWEQGKRPVPASRVQALADALGVTLDELLAGTEAGSSAADLAFRLPGQGHPYDPSAPLLQLLPQTPAAEPEPVEEPPPPKIWVVAERPPLVGWIPPGWEPRDRIQDICPALPDGYWLDPVKLEKPSAKALLRSRLCADDRALVGDRDVPGAALAERIYQHCARADDFLRLHQRLPLIEAIFRAVLAAEHGGLSDAALVETLSVRPGAVPLTVPLLRRLRDSVRPYPMRSVDRPFFGGAVCSSP
jgi:transcriptional regulator with XRE-family HTH domain